MDSDLGVEGPQLYRFLATNRKISFTFASRQFSSLPKTV